MLVIVARGIGTRRHELPRFCAAVGRSAAPASPPRQVTAASARELIPGGTASEDSLAVELPAHKLPILQTDRRSSGPLHTNNESTTRLTEKCRRHVFPRTDKTSLGKRKRRWQWAVGVVVESPRLPLVSFAPLKTGDASCVGFFALPGCDPRVYSKKDRVTNERSGSADEVERLGAGFRRARILIKQLSQHHRGSS